MQSAHARIVLLDGIRVPVLSTSCAWQETTASAQVVLPGTPESRDIPPSTRVDIWDIETRHMSFYRKAQALDTPMTPDGVSAEAFEEACRQSVGSSFWPDWGDDTWSHGASVELAEMAPPHAVHLRFTGEVVQVTPAVQPGGAAQTVLTVQGSLYLLSALKALNLVSGAGTYNAREIRFMGQEGPVIAGTGRARQFAQGIEEILTRDGNIGRGVREIIGTYAGRVNAMWTQRFWRTAVGRQVFALDNDAVLDRILGSSAAKRVVKEMLQYSAEVPLMDLVAAILQIAGYSIYPVPSPFYAPMYPVKVPEPPRRRRGGSSSQPLRIARVIVTDPTGVLRDGAYVGSLSLSGHEVRVMVPSGVAAGPGFSSWEVLLADPRLHLSPASSPVETTDELRQMSEVMAETSAEGVFQDGRQYVYTWCEAIAEVLGTVVRREVRANVAVYPHIEPRVVVTAPPPPDPEESDASSQTWEGRDGYKAGWASRVHTYPLLPSLWWAAPPACNILFREQLESDPFPPSLPINVVTRMLGKATPGVSQGGVSSVEHFTAPARADLNAMLTDVDEHPLDARELASYEYMFGPVAKVHHFDQLSRLVRQEEYRTYLKARLTQAFWSERLGARQKTVKLVYDSRLVLGPAVILLTANAAELDPERARRRQEIAHRIRLLSAMRRALVRCRNRNGTGAASNLLAFLSGMYNLRLLLERNSQADLTMRGFDYSMAVAGAGAYVSTGEIPVEGVSPLDEVINDDNALGDPGTYRVHITRITEDIVDAYLGDTAPDLKAVANTGRLPNGYPSLAQIREWYNQVGPRVSAMTACREALTADIATVDAAIEEARSEARSVGVDGGQASALLVNITSINDVVEPSGVVSTQITYSHGRYVGEDLDMDAQEADDPENFVVFGDTAYMDEKYSAPRIGTELYRPMLGCTSITELPAVKAELDRLAAEASGEADADLITSRELFDSLGLRHPGVCGHECLDEIDPVTGLTRTQDAVAILLDMYRAAAARGEDMFRWFETLKARPGVTLADAYRSAGQDVPRREGGEGGAFDLAGSDQVVYGEGPSLEGFFAHSDVPPDAGPEDWSRVGYPTLTEGADRRQATREPPEVEKAFLSNRARKVRAFVDSCRNRNIVN